MPMPKQLKGKAVSIMKQPNRGKGAGRKPNLVLQWIKECDLSKKNAQDVLATVLSNYTIRELDELRKNEVDNMSVLVFSLVNAAITAAKKGDFSITKQMMEFLFGKDEQPVKVLDDKKLVDLKNLLLKKAGQSQKERERIIAELEKVTGNTE